MDHVIQLTLVCQGKPYLRVSVPPFPKLHRTSTLIPRSTYVTTRSYVQLELARTRPEHWAKSGHVTLPTRKVIGILVHPRPAIEDEPARCMD